MPMILNAADADFEARFAGLLGMKREEAEDVDLAVAAIIADVRARGDAAVIELTARFDRLVLTPATLAFSPSQIEAEVAKVSPEDRAALELAADRIRAYHLRQMPADARWTEASGAELGWRFTPVSAAGLYVPGGLASYPSSVLMNAIPARVAGVQRLVVACPTPFEPPLALYPLKHATSAMKRPNTAPLIRPSEMSSGSSHCWVRVMKVPAERPFTVTATK